MPGRVLWTRHKHFSPFPFSRISWFPKPCPTSLEGTLFKRPESCFLLAGACGKLEGKERKDMKTAKCWMGLWMAVGIATLLLLPSALGETATVDGVTWIYMVEDGKAMVTGATPASGTMAIPSQLGGYAVTEIGYEAFRGKTKITILSIPDSVKTSENPLLMDVPDCKR